MPESAASARFLSEREKLIAIERLRDNRTGLKTTQFKKYQVIEALTDPQCWMIALWNGVGMILNIGGSFLPIIIEDMGFTGITTTLLTLPVGGVECVAMLVAGLLASTFRNGRTLIMFLVCCPTLAGTVILNVAPQSSTWLRCAGVWLLLCVPASYALLLSLISSNVAGTTKKATTTLMSFVLFCVGNVVGPQLWRAHEAPRYQTALRSMTVSMCLIQFLNLALGAYYYFENKRRDKMVAAMQGGQSAIEEIHNEEYFGRTDREDWMKFRYRW